MIDRSRSIDVQAIAVTRVGKPATIDLRMLMLSVQFFACQDDLEHAISSRIDSEIERAYARYTNFLPCEIKGLPNAWPVLDLFFDVEGEADVQTILKFLYKQYPNSMTIPKEEIMNLVSLFEVPQAPAFLH